MRRDDRHSGSRLRFVVVLLLLIGAVSACRAQAAGKFACDPGPDSAALLRRIQALTDSTLAGRGNGTVEAMVAADSIAGWMSAAGLQPAGTEGWFQDFALTGEGLSGRPGRNVIGKLAGLGALADRYVVVGAHYDHLGRLESDTIPDAGPPARGAFYPGANDNASGITALLELAAMAHRLVRGARGDDGAVPLRSCLFVAFAAEEVGLQGSSHFVNQPAVPLDRIDVMINFDCIGQLVEQRLYIAGIGTATSLESLVRKANADSLRLQLSRGGWSASDHVSFNSREIPVLFLFTGPYPEYNRPEDDWPTISLSGLMRVTAYSGRLLSLLRAHAGPFDYVLVQETARPADEGAGVERKAWLGTIPDFTEEVTGVKLAGVIDGSPAQKAGLARGDVLVMLAGRPVADLPGFTQILRDCDPGQQIDLEIIREGRRLSYIVILADRSERQ